MDFDRWFAQTIPATTAYLNNALNRKVYATKEALAADEEAPEDAIVFNHDMKLALLMLIGHWFVNRESSSALSLNETPMGLSMLLSPYKSIYL